MALIGLTGSITGTVAISFPLNTALAIVNRMLGSALGQADGTVIDGVAEFVNIVAGSAKKRLTDEDAPPVTLTLPTVVSGSDYSVFNPAKSTWIEVPFESDLGPFTMRVTMESRAS